MAKVSAPDTQDRQRNQPRKRPGRHSKRIKRRVTKQTFFPVGGSR